MSIESLTVKLHSGETFYFPAGSVVGDRTPRVDLLREAIDHDTLFHSVDESGVERRFRGHEVASYFLH